MKEFAKISHYPMIVMEEIRVLHAIRFYREFSCVDSFIDRKHIDNFCDHIFIKQYILGKEGQPADGDSIVGGNELPLRGIRLDHRQRPILHFEYQSSPGSIIYCIDISVSLVYHLSRNNYIECYFDNNKAQEKLVILMVKEPGQMDFGTCRVKKSQASQVDIVKYIQPPKDLLTADDASILSPELNKMLKPDGDFTPVEVKDATDFFDVGVREYTFKVVASSMTHAMRQVGPSKVDGIKVLNDGEYVMHPVCEVCGRKGDEYVNIEEFHEKWAPEAHYVREPGNIDTEEHIDGPVCPWCIHNVFDADMNLDISEFGYDSFGRPLQEVIAVIRQEIIKNL